MQTDSKEISADLLKRKCIHLQLYEYMYHTAAARAGLRESLRETNTKLGPDITDVTNIGGR